MSGGQDGRISPRFVGSPSVHQGGEPSSRGDIRCSGRFRGCWAPSTGSPGHHNEARTKASRGRSRRLGDCDGLEVRHSPPGGGGGLGDAAPLTGPAPLTKQRDARDAPLGGVHSAAERAGLVSAPVDGRPLLVGGGLSGGAIPPGSAGQTPPTPVGAWERAGHGSVVLEGVGTEIPARDAPRSVRVEGFLPVWGGFSSLTGLKPSSHQTQTPSNPTDQVMDDCVSLGRPAEREHILSKVRCTATAPPAVPPSPPTHQSEEPDKPLTGVGGEFGN